MALDHTYLEDLEYDTKILYSSYLGQRETLKKKMGNISESFTDSFLDTQF